MGGGKSCLKKMMKKLFLVLFFSVLAVRAYALNADELLPAEQAFVPVVEVGESGVTARFSIADGYYLYQSKITAETDPDNWLGEAVFSDAKEKEDEFFGKQQVYYGAAQLEWQPQQMLQTPYRMILNYQGCADVGVCYPPVRTEFEIAGSGVYVGPEGDQAGIQLKKPTGVAKIAAPSFGAEDDVFVLSRQKFFANLLVFFVAGLGLSLTACMYPLLPIVSGIVVGSGSGKMRGFWLSVVYVQGLALTYTLVGMTAGLTGSLLTVWLQQAWVVLTAAVIMALLALAMFGVINIQMPSTIQSYFQNQSNRLSGGKLVSVGIMGMFSALIVGPCVAPPLAFALGYIGQTGDALLGGAALYALALGMGMPLILIATFGASILPKAGEWMNAVRAVFGVLLLGVAIYLASPFLPYALAALLYTLLLSGFALYVLYQTRVLLGVFRLLITAAALGLLGLSVWFAYGSVKQQSTPLHDWVLLYPTQEQSHGKRFSNPAELMEYAESLLNDGSHLPVILDFYADWCVSCREMDAKTFSRKDVAAAVPLARLLQMDVTQNTPEQRAFLKEYGLYGPPGLFALYADGSRSKALIGFIEGERFIQWWNEQQTMNTQK